MCALCQKNTKEKLQCPAHARQTNQGSTYVTLAKNLTKFGECGALSPGILTRLDDGDGVEETFMKKKASFHMSYRLKYNTTKLKRKLASCDPGEESVPAKEVTRREQRSSGDGVVDKDLSCFLCDKKAPAKQRHASTFKVDERIRNCALILQESHLLAKLS
ncbi:hypothetical protein Bpfe_005749 [Biomphalaria pfeifferi]|uniref:Uncharacterized protein n=1 Tax=Biomphalaria pfeifferi TaxID=112525 RepID=A0AAD8C1U6_BIOPF|nr:hypothetical protein Bpfe_005749 [Biomphalaria pfeifferi]